MITQEKSAITQPQKITTSPLLAQKSQGSLKKSFSLKTKATWLAIAIGVIPLTIISTFAYIILNRSIALEIQKEKLDKTEIAADSVTQFLEDRINEIEALSQDAILTDAKFREAATREEKTAILDNFKSQIEYYDSIVFFDVQGNPLFQAKSASPHNQNYSDRSYFKEAVQTQQMTINGPGLSPRTGELRVEFAAPVKDRATEELLGILRFRIPGIYLNRLFEVYEAQNEHWNLINAEGIIFAGDLKPKLNQYIANYFPEIKPLHEAKTSGVLKSQTLKPVEPDQGENTETEDTHSHTEGEKQIVSYVAAQAPEKFPDLHIGTILAIDENIAFASVRKLMWILLLGIAVATIVVAAIAAYIANRAVIPLIDAAKAVQKIGSGQLDIRLAVEREDELGELSSNINLMAQQIKESLQKQQALAEEQQALAEEQRREKEELENAIYTLIDEVSDATEGNLTVRASLDSLELSTVADLFNAIISNLRDIAIETKQSAKTVNYSLRKNEAAIRFLADQAIGEAQKTRNTLASVEQMSQSIQAVAENAAQAEKITDDTYDTVLHSSNDMDLTVDSILNLRTTVGETGKKMKRLAESSQKISQAVSFIEEIALRTNILAINATVEAGRAGEYGQGFTIVAEQVGALAEQSAAATKEIANTVATIQAAILEVSQAMESSTVQVVDSTRLVESTKQSLNLVLTKSQQINQLMRSISQSTVSQATTSQNVTTLMQQITQVAENTSQSSKEVAQSIFKTAQVAQKLESTVAQFQVNESS